MPLFLHVFLALFRGFFNSLFLCAILYLISGCLIHASLVFYMKNNFEFTWETSHPRIREMDVSQFPELVSQTNFLFLFDEGPCNARNVRLYYPYWQYTNFFLFRFCISTLPTLAQWITLVSLLFSLWGRANARNVRLYYPYWQYTNLFIFRFVSLLCLRRTLRLFNRNGLTGTNVLRGAFWFAEMNTLQYFRALSQGSEMNFFPYMKPSWYLAWL